MTYRMFAGFAAAIRRRLTPSGALPPLPDNWPSAQTKSAGKPDLPRGARRAPRRGKGENGQ